MEGCLTANRACYSRKLRPCHVKACPTSVSNARHAKQPRRLTAWCPLHTANTRLARPAAIATLEAPIPTEDTMPQDISAGSSTLVYKFTREEVVTIRAGDAVNTVAAVVAFALRAREMALVYAATAADVPQVLKALGAAREMLLKDERPTTLTTVSFPCDNAAAQPMTWSGAGKPPAVGFVVFRTSITELPESTVTLRSSRNSDPSALARLTNDKLMEGHPVALRGIGSEALLRAHGAVLEVQQQLQQYFVGMVPVFVHAVGVEGQPIFGLALNLMLCQPFQYSVVDSTMGQVQDAFASLPAVVQPVESAATIRMPDEERRINSQEFDGLVKQATSKMQHGNAVTLTASGADQAHTLLKVLDRAGRDTDSTRLGTLLAFPVVCNAGDSFEVLMLRADGLGRPAEAPEDSVVRLGMKTDVASLASQVCQQLWDSGSVTLRGAGASVAFRAMLAISIARAHIQASCERAVDVALRAGRYQMRSNHDSHVVTLFSLRLHLVAARSNPNGGLTWCVIDRPVSQLDLNSIDELVAAQIPLQAAQREASNRQEALSSRSYDGGDQETAELAVSQRGEMVDSSASSRQDSGVVVVDGNMQAVELLKAMTGAMRMAGVAALQCRTPDQLYYAVKTISVSQKWHNTRGLELKFQLQRPKQNMFILSVRAQMLEATSERQVAEELKAFTGSSPRGISNRVVSQLLADGVAVISVVGAEAMVLAAYAIENAQNQLGSGGRLEVYPAWATFESVNDPSKDMHRVRLVLLWRKDGEEVAVMQTQESGSDVTAPAPERPAEVADGPALAADGPATEQPATPVP